MLVVPGGYTEKEAYGPSQYNVVWQAQVGEIGITNLLSEGCAPTAVICFVLTQTSSNFTLTLTVVKVVYVLLVIKNQKYFKPVEETIVSPV